MAEPCGRMAGTSDGTIDRTADSTPTTGRSGF
jgi:hypothetical protein